MLKRPSFLSLAALAAAWPAAAANGVDVLAQPPGDIPAWLWAILSVVGPSLFALLVHQINGKRRVAIVRRKALLALEEARAREQLADADPTNDPAARAKLDDLAVQRAVLAEEERQVDAVDKGAAE